MALELKEKLELLFLSPEGPRYPQFSSLTVRSASPNSSLGPLLYKASPPQPRPRQRPTQSTVAKPASSASFKVSTNSISTADGVFEREASSSSSRDSSICIPTNRQAPPTFVQQFMAGPHYGFDLPCEFFFLGCNLRFHASEIESWISHSALHFVNISPPYTTICTFCDTTFRTRDNPEATWRERMLHIYEHLEARNLSENMRPDFWVIEHLRNNELISAEDHIHAERGTERPYCDHTYPLDYMPPEMLAIREREPKLSYKSRSELIEDRNRFRERKKGQSAHKALTAHKSEL